MSDYILPEAWVAWIAAELNRPYILNLRSIHFGPLWGFRRPWRYHIANLREQLALKIAPWLYPED